jgi:hypothetical protein
MEVDIGKHEEPLAAAEVRVGVVGAVALVLHEEMTANEVQNIREGGGREEGGERRGARGAHLNEEVCGPYQAAEVKDHRSPFPLV